MPIPVSVVSGNLVADAGAFNVNRSEGNDSDGAVLFDQSAQLGDQHPRPRRAVRPDQRRHRAGRRPLHRRRLLRASGVGDARLPRRRAGRSAARPAGHAVRQEHHRRRHQRHHPQAQLHAGNRRRAQLRQPRIRPGQGVGHRARSSTDSRRAAVVLGHPARRHALQRRAPATTSTISTTWACAASCCSRRRTSSRSRWRSTTRASVPRATRRWSPASRRRCAARTGSTPQIAADLGYTPPSFNAFDRRDRRRHAAAVLPGSRRRLAERRLEARAGPADLDHRLALLGLESVERPRLHRPADHHDLGRAVEAAAVDAGGALRRRRVARAELRRRRLRLPPGARLGPSFKQEQGAAAARFLLAPSANAATPGLLDGYGYNQYVEFGNVSAAVFGQLEWSVTDRLRLLPGSPVQLRPEGRGLRSAGLRRPADDQSRR